MSLDQVAASPQRRKERLSDQVAETLRAELTAGRWKPGRRLPAEVELTATFGVSRTVIREAIAALAADGLVEARQGAGVFVLSHPSTSLGALALDMDSKDSIALSVLEVRLALEVESAGLAAVRSSAAHEAAMQEAIFEYERLLRLGQPTGPADLSFHRAIASATGNPFYVEMLDVLGRRAIPCDVTSPYGTEKALTTDYQTMLQREHLGILAAITARDPDAARDAMRQHLGLSQQRYRDRLQRRRVQYIDQLNRSIDNAPRRGR